MKIALITGASSGIGKQFALGLDNDGLDEIWAVALKGTELDNLQSEMKTKIRTFGLDLTLVESFGIIQSELEKFKPEVLWLINCSGYGKFGRYDEIEMLNSLGMIDLNCRGYVGMTKSALPYMPNKSRIVNIGSMASWLSVPFANVYAATKAFVLSYSRGLNVELKDRKISVTCVCPFWTKTEFFKRAESKENDRIKKYIVMYDAKKVVARGIKSARKRKEVSFYGFMSKVFFALSKILPHKLMMKIWINQQK
ncbi:MAG: SDR family NAD(P)-dependent oxidoreductase [Clostridia bacterium]|nr:SDR family NAD(P)-dependent oxidoreductase [Clostridia bacterium]